MPRSINDVIDELGCGHAQFLLCLFGGGLYWVDGVIMTLFATLPSAIAMELGLNRFHRATLFSSAILGLLLGNYTNIVNDSYFGRRKPILFGYVCAILCAMASAAFHTFWPIAWCWMVAGFGLGLGLPAWNTLCVETCPSSKRMLIGGVSQVFYSISAITVLAVELSYSWDFNVGSHWREIVIWTQLPNILLAICACLFGFVDSPHCSMAQGNVSQARAELETMRRQNNCPHVSIDFDVNTNAGELRPGAFDVLKVLFCRKLIGTTCVMCLTTAVINFVGYGIGYSLPIMLPQLDLGVHPPIVIMSGSVAEVVGYFIAITASARMPRIHQMVWFFCLTILYCMIMSFGIFRLDYNQSDVIGKVSITFVCLTIQTVTAPGWLVVYTYAGEVFPTMCRSFAGGFVIGCGRFGSMIAPFVFEEMHRATHTFVYFFISVTILMAITVTSITLVLKETKGKPLATSLDEEEPLMKSGQQHSKYSSSGSPININASIGSTPSKTKFSDF
jgi:MFS family permease